jgi:hypothetical protein
MQGASYGESSRASEDTGVNQLPRPATKTTLVSATPGRMDRNDDNLTSQAPAIDKTRTVLIAVIGIIRAGKSTFVKIASGDDAIETGHTLDSCKLYDYRRSYKQRLIACRYVRGSELHILSSRLPYHACRYPRFR